MMCTTLLALPHWLPAATFIVAAVFTVIAVVCLMITTCLLRRKYRRQAVGERQAAHELQLAAAEAAQAEAAAGRASQPAYVVPVVIVQPDGDVILAEQVAPSPSPDADGGNAPPRSK
jgi:heme exporter protein D